MNHGSLFSGIGGFDLAAEWCGWNNIFQVEIDEFCRKVLKKNFPKTKQYEDIKQFDGKQYTGKIDVISGGFPCQPFSVAGKRKGRADDRYLWHEMLRVISEIKPTYVVGENVTGILNMEFDKMLIQLEDEGYSQVEIYIIPAIAVNAPHRRDRVWIVAHSNSITSKNTLQGQDEILYNKDRTVAVPAKKKREQYDKPGRSDNIPTDIEVARLQIEWEQSQHSFNPRHFNRDWVETAFKLCRMDNGISEKLDRHRTKRLKAIGNAIIPQIAFEIFNKINDLQKLWERGLNA